MKMSKMDIMWQPKISRTALLDNFLEVHINLWVLAGEILETEEITDELFKKIGEVLVDKIWFWESVEKALNEEFLM